MKTYIRILLLFIGVSTLASCYKDLGNYEYHDLNDVSIIGLDSAYSVINGNVLAIELNLDQTKLPKSDSSYTFEWFAFQKGTGLNISGDRFNLGNTKDLNWTANLKSGDYWLIVRVTDKETGVFYEERTKLHTDTEFNTGWLVLSDRDGKPEFSIIGLDNDSVVYFYDALKANAVDFELTGQPLGIVRYAYLYNRGYLYGVYVNTTDGMNRFDINDSLVWKPTNNIVYEMAGDFSVGYYPEKLMPVGARLAYMYDKGNFYLRNVMGYVNYGIPINIFKGETQSFKVSPYFATNANSGTSGNTILYDTDNHRFIRHSVTSSSCNLMPDEGDDLLPYQDPNYDLVYMASSTAYNENEALAVMQNISTKKFYFLRILNKSSSSSIKEEAFVEMNATDFDKAEDICISKNRGYVFYHVGGIVYQYDGALNKTFKMMDLGNADITYFGFMTYSSNSTRANRLLIATYDQSTGGSFKAYDVPSINAPLELAEEYEGFGRIKDIAF